MFFVDIYSFSPLVATLLLLKNCGHNFKRYMPILLQNSAELGKTLRTTEQSKIYKKHVLSLKMVCRLRLGMSYLCLYPKCF